MLNSRLNYLERSFIIEQGIYPERSSYRHLIFTTSYHNEYGAAGFAGIIDPAVEWRNEMAHGNSKKAKHWLETVKIGLTKLQYAIESATLVLSIEGYYD